jgi:hypothetical protein
MYREQVPVPSAARTLSGASEVVDTLAGMGEGPGVFDRARFYLNVSAASGTTPNLALKIVGVINGIEYDLTPAFGAKTGIAKETILIESCPRFVKFVWTITGTTPSFTFEAGFSR